MELKNPTREEIVARYNKSNFVMPPLEALDELIGPFLIELNERDHIYTHFSCEGHSIGDDAYLFFIVDEEGYDIFFHKIVPELAHKFSFNSDQIVTHLDWYFYLKDNSYNSGISIHCKLNSGTFHWFEQKEIFWKAIEELFLENFK